MLETMRLCGVLLASSMMMRATVASPVLDMASQAPKSLPWRMDVVHKNPGEGPTNTKYTDPLVVEDLGYNIMTVANGKPPHTAITWDDFDATIFPEGSEGRKWVEDLAEVIDDEIEAIQKTGMKAMYWFDIFVLPRTLVAKYEADITDSQGRWSLDSKMMPNITEYMVDAVFKRFPKLDGLLVRTGEIYTQDVPFHLGASPITDAARSHTKLVNILKDVVIDRNDKLLFYRTWSFDGFTKDPEYYLDVTNAVEPHEKLIFVIKHTTGDFWRTTEWNPTVDIGKHQYVVEIQCQREYEGKGAFPNYIMNGVIDGFEENKNDPGPKSLVDIRDSPLFKGVVTWSRGGGWRGPYPVDEFWIDMNVRVIAKWAEDPSRTEEEIFKEYARKLEMSNSPEIVSTLREVALLSARGVLLGHYSLKYQLKQLPWTRDWYIGGGDKELKEDFEGIINQGLVSDLLDEKAEASRIWDDIVNKTTGLTEAMTLEDRRLKSFLNYSVRYGRLLYKLIEESWTVSLLGMEGKPSGDFDVERISDAIAGYDRYLDQYNGLTKKNCSGTISQLYTPFGWGDTLGPDKTTGSNNSVNMWRYVEDDEI